MRTLAWLIAPAACAAVMATPALAAPGPRQAEAAALDRAIAAYRIPAMSVVLIRDGKAEPEVARGVRRIDRPDRVRTGERWLLGSDTKAMTATLVGRLVDQGRLSWTARLDRMLPDLAAGMRPEYRDLTLVDLLSHHAGLPEELSDSAFVMARFEDTRPMGQQRLDYIRKGLADAPIAPPRSKYSYSNTGFLIAAVIAERAGGKPYEALMREQVFGPLGMASATFAKPGPGELTGHASGHVAKLLDTNPSVFSAAGEVRMTMADWGRFCVDQLAGGRGRGRLLKPATYAAIQSLHDGQAGTGWAFGWHIQPSAFGRAGPAITHTGSDGTWIADVVLYPNSRSGMLIATNAAYDMGAQKAMAEAEHELAPLVAPPKPAAP